MTRSGAQRQQIRRRALLALAASVIALFGPFALRAVPVVDPAAADAAVLASPALQGTHRGGAHNEVPQALVQQHAVAPLGDSMRIHAVTGGSATSTQSDGLSDLATLRTELTLVARVIAAAWWAPAPPVFSSRAARAPPAVHATA